MTALGVRNTEERMFIPEATVSSSPPEGVSGEGRGRVTDVPPPEFLLELHRWASWWVPQKVHGRARFPSRPLPSRSPPPPPPRLVDCRGAAHSALCRLPDTWKPPGVVSTYVRTYPRRFLRVSWKGGLVRARPWLPPRLWPGPEGGRALPHCQERRVGHEAFGVSRASEACREKTGRLASGRVGVGRACPAATRRPRPGSGSRLPERASPSRACACVLSRLACSSGPVLRRRPT